MNNKGIEGLPPPTNPHVEGAAVMDVSLQPPEAQPEVTPTGWVRAKQALHRAALWGTGNTIFAPKFVQDTQDKLNAVSSKLEDESELTRSPQRTDEQGNTKEGKRTWRGRLLAIGAFGAYAAGVVAANPATAAQLARAGGAEFAPDDLNTPDTNTPTDYNLTGGVEAGTTDDSANQGVMDRLAAKNADDSTEKPKDYNLTGGVEAPETPDNGDVSDYNLTGGIEAEATDDSADKGVMDRLADNPEALNDKIEAGSDDDSTTKPNDYNLTGGVEAPEASGHGNASEYNLTGGVEVETEEPPRGQDGSATPLKADDSANQGVMDRLADNPDALQDRVDMADPGADGHDERNEHGAVVRNAEDGAEKMGQLTAAPDLSDEFAHQLGLEEQDGALKIQGLDKWTGQTEEDSLYHNGTGYHKMEELLRSAGLTNEQIKDLEENGELRELIGEMLEDSGVTWSENATGAEGERLDTELPVGFQFTISDHLLEEIHNLHPPEMPITEELGTMGLSEEQIKDLDSGVGNLNQSQINELYGSTGIKPPAFEDIHSLSDLPVPDTLDGRQHFFDNLHGLILETVTDNGNGSVEPNDIKPNEHDEAIVRGIDGNGDESNWYNNPAIVAPAAAAAGATVAGGAVAGVARRRGRKEEQRREWIDDNTSIVLYGIRGPEHVRNGYRNNARDRMYNQANNAGLSHRDVMRQLNNWFRFVLGEDSDAAARTARLEQLYNGLVDDTTGNPFYDGSADPVNYPGSLRVPVEGYGPGNNSSRIDPEFAIELQSMLADPTIRADFAEYLQQERGIDINNDFWNLIDNNNDPDSPRILLADLLLSFGPTPDNYRFADARRQT